MAEQFGLILTGMFIGSGIVWFLTRSKVKGLEAELRRAQKEKAEEKEMVPGLEGFNEKMQKEKEARKEKILAALAERGRIANNDVEKLVGVADATATNYLQELEDEGKIVQKGAGRSVYYEPT